MRTKQVGRVSCQFLLARFVETYSTDLLSCDITVHNVRDDPKAAARAKAAHIARLPMVLVDGKPLECCHIGPVTEAALRAAGVGKA